MIYAQYLKRLLDLVGSILMIIMSSWLVVMILIIYLITWNVPVLFIQHRTGRNGKPFSILKFRTLTVDANAPVSQRRFLIGDFLRATSLDELPQLINVLKGEMSFVGPRPLPVEYLSLYSKEQQLRHNIRPGITGWAQVNGRNSIQWSEKFKLDNYYIHNVSFGLDLLILIKTIALLFSVRKDVSLEEKPFTRN